jgi:hypothetical protein
MGQWVAPGHLCFKVKAADRIYLLKYHQAQDIWEAELVRFGAGPSASGKN